MVIVNEVIDRLPEERPLLEIERDEACMYQTPDAAMMRFVTPEIAPLAVYKVPHIYEPMQYAPPRGVFEGPIMRLEWQTMNGRQPFYHRNADVDEIGYQICGERTQMTEFGTIEFKPGEFSCIPAGVGHDNYGREDIHLIFYIRGPTTLCVPPLARGEFKMPPFPGWQPARMMELCSRGMAALGCDVAYSMIDEQLLLKAAERFEQRIELVRAPGLLGETQWIYKAAQVWMGHTTLNRTPARAYTRHLCADEIQYQISGSRTLVTQRGVVTLHPGEFVSIPLGCAFASTTEGPSQHLSILTTENVPAVRQPDRMADMKVAALLSATPPPTVETTL
jgi:uncharacterized cupin superfamily protein